MNFFKKFITTIIKTVTPKEVAKNVNTFKKLTKNPKKFFTSTIKKAITPTEVVSGLSFLKKVKKLITPEKKFFKNEIQKINESKEIEQPKERKAVNVDFFTDILNDKDGEKMANNLIKSLYNSLHISEITKQDSGPIRQALESFQRLCDRIGYSNAGNYIYYLKETGEINEITFTNLYSSSSDLVGEVVVNNNFIRKINDKQKINEFLNTLELIKNWLG